MTLENRSPAVVPRGGGACSCSRWRSGTARGRARLRAGMGRRDRGGDRDVLPRLQVAGLLGLDDRQRGAVDLSVLPRRPADARLPAGLVPDLRRLRRGAVGARHRLRIGFNPRVRDRHRRFDDRARPVASVVVYWNQPGYRGTTLVVARVRRRSCSRSRAMWMDAFRYRLNWSAWTLSNCFRRRSSGTAGCGGRSGRSSCTRRSTCTAGSCGRATSVTRAPGASTPSWKTTAAVVAGRARGAVMRRGLVFGKFMPLHRGHQHLIDTALSQCDDLTIVVYDSGPARGLRADADRAAALAGSAGSTRTSRTSLRSTTRRSTTPIATPRSTPRCTPSSFAFLGRFDRVFS